MPRLSKPEGQQQRFGSTLRRYRLAAGLSQQQLAERANLSTDAISALERGVRSSPRRETVRLLAEALDLSRSDQAALEQAIGRGRGRRRRATVAPNGVLPAPANQLIGRDDEVRSAAALLRTPGVRLLTLIGPPGTGKTRLALAIADELRGDFPDGVEFIDLSPLTDPTLVGPTLARGLGLEEREGNAAPGLLENAFGDRRVLLVLDNFDHVLDAASLVTKLLANSSALRIIATSRAALSLRSEHVRIVSPLALPELNGELPLEKAGRSPAVALFVDRARATNPRFNLGSHNVQAVAEICARLDGLPLAIELAAARITVLSAPAILAHLDEGLDLLSDGPRDLPGRHYALRDAIGWSYDRLNSDEAKLFRRVAVVPAGFTRDAAQAVGALGEDKIQLVRTLAALVGQSLLCQDGSHPLERRFRMLETIREFALEELRAHGEEVETRRRYYDWLLALAEKAGRARPGPERESWFDRLEREHDNLRAALAWATEVDPQLTLRLATLLWPFWEARGHLAEERKWLKYGLPERGQNQIRG
ncbi:MAG TPA: helix-turn-helix domain-containing protein [Chloroflexota bacterium]|nr:helix-turn-helix domain-containing protein [Chloroflexota bacterium]